MFREFSNERCRLPTDLQDGRFPCRPMRANATNGRANSAGPERRKKARCPLVCAVGHDLPRQTSPAKVAPVAPGGRDSLPPRTIVEEVVENSVEAPGRKESRAVRDELSMESARTIRHAAFLRGSIIPSPERAKVAAELQKNRGTRFSSNVQGELTAGSRCSACVVWACRQQALAVGDRGRASRAVGFCPTDAGWLKALVCVRALTVFAVVLLMVARGLMMRPRPIGPGLVPALFKINRRHARDRAPIADVAFYAVLRRAGHRQSLRPRRRVLHLHRAVVSR